MSFLRTLFGQKPKLDRKSAISGCKIVYGQDADLEAQRRQIPIGYKFYHPITLIQKVALPGPVRVIVDCLLLCRKHNQRLDPSVEVSFMMMPQSAHLKLPCGCVAEISMCNGDLNQLFLKADSKFNLAVEDIREGRVVDENVDFSECPNCKNTVKPGSGAHFFIYQCVECGTRYCYDCAGGKGCPKCKRHTERFGVGEVKERSN